MGQPVNIRPDHQPGWWIAEGQQLLDHTHRIPTVEKDAHGIAFQDAYRGEVLAALRTAGYRITELATTRPTPTPPKWQAQPHIDEYGTYHPEEAATCVQCNPEHDPSEAIAEAKRAVAEAIAALKARSDEIKTG